MLEKVDEAREEAALGVIGLRLQFIAMPSDFVRLSGRGTRAAELDFGLWEEMLGNEKLLGVEDEEGDELG